MCQTRLNVWATSLPLHSSTLCGVEVKRCGAIGKKRRKVVSRIHERIANRRNNCAHQESRKLINRFGILAFEDVNITRMRKNHCLAKGIADASWNQFVLVTTSKAAEAGHRFVLVDPGNTSKRCSRCGQLVEKGLSVRVHACPVCGLSLDRDENATINILALGLQCLGASPEKPRSFENLLPVIP